MAPLHSGFWMGNRLTVGERKITFTSMQHIVQPFWRKEPLNPDENTLVNELFSAHQKSCFRENVSSVVFANTMAVTDDFGKSVAAAILTTGEKHAPIKQTIWFLTQPHPEEAVENMLSNNQKIPGWGGTFQKFGRDPIWKNMDRLISELHPELSKKLVAVTDVLILHGKTIYPNPSAYTACVAIAIAMPPGVASYLFIAGRLTGWAQIAL
jgi:citrate synthase